MHGAFPREIEAYRVLSCNTVTVAKWISLFSGLINEHDA